MSRNSVLSSTLEQCPYNVFLSFQKCLDNSDNWKLFVKSLTILGKELSSLEIDQLDIESRKIGGSPAKYIWFKLQSWLTTTQELITVLRHCQLLDPLLVLVGPEPLEIITQPGSDEEDRFVNHGAKVILTCEAKGLPLPSYQWFHNNQALPKENGTQLCLDNINCDDTGAYYCQVSHTHPDSTEYKLFSHYVNLTVKPPIPRITSQPNELHALHSGRSLMLRIYCVPPPEEVQINWYHNGQLLTGEHSSVLFLENISSQQEGHYLCELSNESGSVFSKDMNVIVVPPPSTLRSHDADDAGDRRASCKMALLIANYTYDNMQNLKTPCKDIARIATILEGLDFIVFAACNLTRDETCLLLQQFCYMVPPKAYLWFYYVGHGFLMNDKYLMPVECPENDFLRAHCVCDKHVMSMLLRTDPQLIIFVLDMCLARPEREINPHIYQEEAVYQQDCRLNSTCSIFEAFATRWQSYERSNAPLGIYAHHLVKFLSDRTLSVSNIFLEAHADLIKHNSETNQRPLICVDAASKFKLSDSFLSPIHKRVLDLFSQFNTIKKTSFKLDLPQCSSKVTVTIAPYNCILNVLSVTINTGVALECRTTEEGAQIEWIRKDSEQQTLLIHHLQRVKEKLELGISLSPVTSTDTTPTTSSTTESCEEVCLSLGRPLIIRALCRPYIQSKWKNYQQNSSKPVVKS